MGLLISEGEMAREEMHIEQPGIPRLYENLRLGKALDVFPEYRSGALYALEDQ